MHIILRFALTIVCTIILIVLGSYAIRRYELGNRKGGDECEKLSVPQVALCMAAEAAAVSASIVLYPFGWVFGGASIARLRPGMRPVILCHGYMHNRSGFFLMRYRLKKAGWSNTLAPNFRPASAGVPYFAEKLSKIVDAALLRTGCDKADLIGHSMGGLVARYFVETLGGAARVDKVVTLGSPHSGTKMAALGIFRSAGQFRPDSPLITGLKQSAERGVTASLTAIWSDFDSVILPHENARLSGTCGSAVVHGVGHMSMLFSGRVFEEVRRALSEMPE